MPKRKTVLSKIPPVEIGCNLADAPLFTRAAGLVGVTSSLPHFQPVKSCRGLAPLVHLLEEICLLRFRSIYLLI